MRETDGSNFKRKLKKSISGLSNIFLDVIYPRRCPVCDGVLPFQGELICPECERRLIRVKEPRCRKCGKMLKSFTEEYCGDCRAIEHVFNKGLSLYLYNDAMQGAIFRFKYKGRREYADFFSESMAKYLGSEILSLKASTLIPIPLHKSRQKERGFNQAEVLSKRLGERLNIPVRTDVIYRIRNTRPLKTLSREERRKNLKRAFKIGQNVVKLNNVILVDDIYTSGSTMDEASEVLREAGIRRVYALTLCTGVPV